ncbi:NAD(P)/FAD-dependent oxidoreductase [Rubrivirga sp. IMCC45206]|uniref:NAD(P)/FAD-dependent oxidoreductase n=1 Tax=Rubrivirga sp. IMCC45206 TaxID=3391614 RepID=UPI0039902817
MNAFGLPPGTRPHVVVVGAGHGGLACIEALESAAVDVTIVDRNNYHKFQPLLYQVATAGLGADDITQSIRHIVRRQENADVLMGLVVDVDTEARVLTLDTGDTVGYDALVLAAGASTAYFGVEGAQAHSFPLKNVPDALALRSHVLSQFEAAAREPSRVGEGVLTVVVVGGGPTGVEMAGALRELSRVLAKDFPRLDVKGARVVLVDGETLPLGGYDPSLRTYTADVLEEKGVELQMGQNVERVDARGVTLADGSRIEAQTVVWAAGVRAVPLADAVGVEQTRAGRIAVDATLRVPGHDRVFVIGDLAGARDAEGELYPQVAQVAIQQGRHAAALIEAMDTGARADAPFEYRDLGQMATIGRSAAVLQTPGGLTMTGLVAWLGWLAVHLVALVGFRNRISVLWSWFYNYLTYDRGPRLILTDGGGPRPVLATAPTTGDARGGSHDPALADEPGEEYDGAGNA